MTTQVHVAPLRAWLAERPTAWRIGAVLIGSWLIAASSWMSAPMYPVPMTMQTYAVLIIAALGGWTVGFGAIVAYLIEGALGLPVFANGGAGLAYMAGPTGGFLLGFLLSGAIAAFAAGNRVWLKPSERCLRTSGFLSNLIQEYFHPTEFCVTTGGAEVAEQFAALPFDYLFFTGNESIGKKVMRSAAEHLTPITLELGGKSPAIVDSTANLKDAAASIIYGKLLNSGQTCIAPDYVLIERSQQDTFIQELKAAAQEQFSNPDELTGPIDAAQLQHWQHLVADALDRGAKAISLLKTPATSARKFEPVVLIDIPAEARILHEEIFGPILPIVTITNTQAAIELINKKPHPLALYWFGKDKKNMQKVLSETRSGGVTINETLLHITVESLPFGGTGASGMGAYHGKVGFDLFSHRKSVLQVRGFLGLNLWKGSKLARPPYGKTVERLLRFLK
jgi:coniferyl-aldehyde dehydrogenase